MVVVRVGESTGTTGEASGTRSDPVDGRRRRVMGVGGSRGRHTSVVTVQDREGDTRGADFSSTSRSRRRDSALEVPVAGSTETDTGVC